MDHVFQVRLLVIPLPGTHGAVNAEVNAPTRNPRSVGSEYTPPHVKVRSHTFWDNAHGITESFLAFWIFSKALAIMVSVAYFLYR